MIEVLIYFGLGVLFSFFAKKWWLIFTQKPSDDIISAYSLFWLIWAIFMLAWIFLTLSLIGAFLQSQDKTSPLLLTYFISFYFGPITLVIAFLRKTRFVHTSMGKKLGFSLPTLKKLNQK
jgi:Na+-driven multidrug efflux pump